MQTSTNLSSKFMKTEMNFNKTYHITPLNGGISTQNPS